jgi:hypothetical protein
MPRARREGEYLVIQNRSTSATAEQFKFILEDGARGVLLFYDRKPIDLLPDSDMRWALNIFLGSGPQLRLTMRWMEDGEPQEVTQFVAL